jgi:hypothetical protein
LPQTPACRRAGGIIVDTTQQPLEGLGHPFGYFPQAFVEERDEEDVKRMVREYDPDREFVVVLIKPGERLSTYRVQTTNYREGQRRRLGEGKWVPLQLSTAFTAHVFSDFCVGGLVCATFSGHSELPRSTLDNSCILSIGKGGVRGSIAYCEPVSLPYMIFNARQQHVGRFLYRMRNHISSR